MDKISIKEDKSMTAIYPKNRPVKITRKLKEKTKLVHQLDYSRGDPRNPLTDEELENKFCQYATPVFMTNAQAKKILNRIWQLENENNIHWLVKTFIS